MIKKLFLLLSVYLVIAGCANDESNVQVFVGSSTFAVIPASTSSCYARQTTVIGVPPAIDIGSSYFRIATINFGRKDATKDFIVSTIKITMQIPNVATPYICTYGGDQLAALSTEWTSSATKFGESIIVKDKPTFQTSCPLYCGDLDMTKPGVATGTLEVFGLERDAKGEETPVKIQTSLSIQSF